MMSIGTIKVRILELTNEKGIPHEKRKAKEGACTSTGSSAP